MEAIFEAAVVPLLLQASKDVRFYQKSIYADEIMESVLAPLIEKVMHDNPSVYIKSHPKCREATLTFTPHIEFHLSTFGKPLDKPEEQLEKAATQLAGLIKKNRGQVFLKNNKFDVAP
jgi:molybdopterin-biosynthesis enzyme MoeA-like protein